MQEIAEREVLMTHYLTKRDNQPFYLMRWGADSRHIKTENVLTRDLLVALDWEEYSPITETPDIPEVSKSERSHLDELENKVIAWAR